MSKFILKDARFFLDGLDLAGYSNKIELPMDAEPKETTNYGSSGWKEFIGGLKSGELSAEGQLDVVGTASVTGPSDLSQRIGAVAPWTVSPVDTTVGNVAYLTRGVQTQFTMLGEVGEVAPWSAQGNSAYPVARGAFMHPSGTARTASGTGTAVQAGATTAALAMYANLHVLSVSGTTPSLTVAVESDNASGFPSTAVRGTFTAANAAGGQTMKITGANADDYWRVTWTISGTTPSFLFVVAIGLGPA